MPPFLLPDPPLQRAVLAQAGYQEFAIFRSRARSDWAVVLYRPGFLPRGRVMQDPRQSEAVLRGGAAGDVEVEVHGGSDRKAVRELMPMVLNSITPG
jgi:hypothetical protein